jgi:hypothetical protein
LANCSLAFDAWKREDRLGSSLLVPEYHKFFIAPLNEAARAAEVPHPAEGIQLMARGILQLECETSDENFARRDRRLQGSLKRTMDRRNSPEAMGSIQRKDFRLLLWPTGLG